MRLTSLGTTGLGSPRWSPDGRRIAFDSSAAGGWDIYIIDAAGGKPEHLTAGSSNEHAPSWSRDGKWIYFASNRDGEFQVWKLPLDSRDAEPVRVTRQGGYAAFESADGRTLYYSRQGNNEETSIWSVPLAGGPEKRVLGSVYIRNFSITDHGLILIPPRTVSGLYEIRFFDFAARAELPFASLRQTPYSTLAATGDGRYVFYTAVDQHGGDLMLVNNFR
jgi:hypothetical protein